MLSFFIMIKILFFIILFTVAISVSNGENNYGEKFIETERTCFLDENRARRINACAWVGNEYYEGVRIHFNYDLAEYYLSLACNHGHLISCKLYQELISIGNREDPVWEK